jgi:hypothetical protein
MHFRTFVAGAAVAALCSATIPASACDGRYAATCEARPQADAADAAPALNIKPAPHVRAARPSRTARTEHHRRARLALTRHRHRTADVSDERPPAPAPVAQSRPETTTARRFRSFINPQSFATTPVEDLRKPIPNASHLAGAVADPRLVPVAWESSRASEEAVPAAPIVAHDEASGDDQSEPALVVAQSEMAEVRRAASDGGAHMSFLSWFFIAWGGVLTLASALRLVVG